MTTATTTYTRKQIEAGEGMFTSGRRTAIIGTPEGRYITADPSDQINVGAGYYLAGGGIIRRDHTTLIEWCD